METADERKSLGQVIRALRELKGMSRADLATQSKLGVDMIAKIEQGAKSPSTSALQRLAGVFDVDAVELSSRGQIWGQALHLGTGSTAVLRQVATGTATRGAIVGMGAVVGAAALPVGAVAAAAPLAVTAAIINKRRHRVIAEEIRLALIEQLAQAQTQEDLIRIAEELKAVAEAGPLATGSMDSQVSSDPADEQPG